MNPNTPTSFGDANGRLDLRSMREILKDDWKKRDRRFYRSLAERDATGEPASPAETGEPSGVDRRNFLKLMGGSAALAGLAACTRQPKELIVPYVKTPEEILPGKPLFFATVRDAGGYAQGLLVESNMGRPTKIEGNPRHPASLGGTDTFAQASVLDLYDPDRATGTRKNNIPKDFASFKSELEAAMAKDPGGLRLLLPPSSSPTEQRLCEALLSQYPGAKIHRWSPVDSDSEAEATRRVFGKPLLSVPHFGKADVVVGLDADFLAWSPSKVRNAKDFASRRRREAGVKRNRFYAVESGYSLTGSTSDDRLAIRAGRVEGVARALAAALGLGGAAPELTAREEAFVAAMAEDLRGAGKAGLVVAGPQQPAAVHAIAHVINHGLGAIGETIDFIEPVLLPGEDLASLVHDMRDGSVKTLLILGVNPVHGAPATLQFAAALEKVPFTAHLGHLVDETSRKCLWSLSLTHYLETWADLSAFDGTLSIAQPLIAPLYSSKSIPEILSIAVGDEKSAHELVQETWKARTGLGGDEDGWRTFWRTTLHEGSIAGTAAKPWKGLHASSDVLADVWTDPVADFGLEVVFQPDPRVWDGAQANNPWLQELPAPVSTVTWDTVFTLSPATARKYRIELTDENVQSRTQVRPKVQVLELNFQNRVLSGPVLVIPGHPDDSLGVTLGGGREVGRVAKDVGYNAATLRGVSDSWVLQGVAIRQLRRWVDLALTQDHFPLQADGRAIIRSATLPQALVAPSFPTQMVHQPDSAHTLYPGWDYSKGYQWGMVVDLNTCTGCNACIVACQAENNIPTVGKDQVLNGRQMHWIRVDRYFEDLPNGETRLHVMPMACVHCENAPCETVCPVGATMHSTEGLNMMVYNRCVGTRYCSNNCPYKVRRFNFHKYTDDQTESLKFQRNPNVTVRLRGVMEKCTYCVQRINNARIDAKVKNRTLEDGEVVTACQQACPAGAIVFGDINNPHSRVAALKKDPLNYSILEPLNTRARTSYLGKVRNPSPALEPTATTPLVFHHGPAAHPEAAGDSHAVGDSHAPAGSNGH